MCVIPTQSRSLLSSVWSLIYVCWFHRVEKAKLQLGNVVRLVRWLWWCDDDNDWYCPFSDIELDRLDDWTRVVERTRFVCLRDGKNCLLYDDVLPTKKKSHTSSSDKIFAFLAGSFIWLSLWTASELCFHLLKSPICYYVSLLLSLPIIIWFLICHFSGCEKNQEKSSQFLVRHHFNHS